LGFRVLTGQFSNVHHVCRCYAGTVLLLRFWKYSIPHANCIFYAGVLKSWGAMKQMNCQLHRFSTLACSVLISSFSRCSHSFMPGVPFTSSNFAEYSLQLQIPNDDAHLALHLINWSCSGASYAGGYLPVRYGSTEGQCSCSRILYWYQAQE
jgi:hypothetical protein